MKRVLLLLLALVACTSDRERDCAEVKRIIDAKDPLHPPRRHWEYEKPKGSTDVVDMSPFERLKKLDYRDAEVKRAVEDMVQETGWTVYSPYDANAKTKSAADRLAKLCGLTRTTVEVR